MSPRDLDMLLDQAAADLASTDGDDRDRHRGNDDDDNHSNRDRSPDG